MVSSNNNNVNNNNHIYNQRDKYYPKDNTHHNNHQNHYNKAIINGNNEGKFDSQHTPYPSKAKIKQLTNDLKQMNPKLPKPPNFVQSTDCPFDDNTDMLELLNKFYQIVHPISKID